MKFDPRDYLGRPFDSLGLSPASYEEDFRSWHAEEGMAPDWTVELRDGSLQLLLNEERTVITVFVCSKAQIAESFGLLPAVSTVDDVVERLGTPTRSGPATEIPALGKKGPWLRYDTTERVMHVEFEPGGRGIHMVTLMLPEHAP